MCDISTAVLELSVEIFKLSSISCWLNDLAPCGLNMLPLWKLHLHTWNGKINILPDHGHVDTAFEKCSQSSVEVHLEKEGLEVWGPEATLVNLYFLQRLAFLTKLNSPSNLKVWCWKVVAVTQDYWGTLFREEKKTRKNSLCHLKPSSLMFRSNSSMTELTDQFIHQMKSLDVDVHTWVRRQRAEEPTLALWLGVILPHRRGKTPESQMALRYRAHWCHQIDG